MALLIRHQCATCGALVTYHPGKCRWLHADERTGAEHDHKVFRVVTKVLTRSL